VGVCEGKLMSPELLRIIVCPVCRGDLEYNGERDILICRGCGVYYEIREGIPVLLPDEGKPLAEGSF